MRAPYKPEKNVYSEFWMTANFCSHSFCQEIRSSKFSWAPCTRQWTRAFPWFFHFRGTVIYRMWGCFGMAQITKCLKAPRVQQCPSPRRNFSSECYTPPPPPPEQRRRENTRLRCEGGGGVLTRRLEKSLATLSTLWPKMTTYLYHPLPGILSLGIHSKGVNFFKMKNMALPIVIK